MKVFAGSLLGLAISNEYLFYIIVIACFVPLTILGIVASISVNSTFSKYSAVTSGCGLTAAEVARKVLDSEGLYSVAVNKTAGHLTDHFDPRSNTLALSESVYSSRSVGAIAVAIHEVGHAIQHEKKFVFAILRVKLVPVVNIANRALFPIMMVGMIFGFATPFTLLGNILTWAGVIVFGLSMLFSLVTLPTEFDASRRAQNILKDGYFTREEAVGSRKVLTAAAMTYVVSFLMSLLQFLRFVAMLLMNHSRDD